MTSPPVLGQPLRDPPLRGSNSVSRRLVLIAVPVAALGLVFAILLARELIVSKPLPPSPVPRATQPPATASGPRSPGRPPAEPSSYAAVSARSLFSPARSETPVAAATKVAGRPLLHGVVLDGPRSRAFIEESSAKGVFGYTVGDSVDQGRIATINADRVLIRGPEGSFEVLLSDPAKPKPVPLGVTPATPQSPVNPPGIRRPTPVPVASQPGGAPVTGRRSQGSTGKQPDDDD